MQGVVLSVGSQSLILGDDGVRYTFTQYEWRNDDRDPELGMRVDFETRGSQATDIYPIPGESPPSEKRTKIRYEAIGREVVRFIAIFIAVSVSQIVCDSIRNSKSSSLPNIVENISKPDIPETCQDLVPIIVDMSAQEAPKNFQPTILAIYSERIDVRRGASNNHMQCVGNARLSNGRNAPIKFWIEKDRNGQYFFYYQEDPQAWP